MNKPTLDRTFETFVYIGDVEAERAGRHIHLLRTVVGPELRRLERTGLIDWYLSLIHNIDSCEVPRQRPDTGKDWQKTDRFLHVRMSPYPAGGDKALGLDPAYFFGTKIIEPGNLTGLWNEYPLQMSSGDVLDAWQRMGHQSEWVLDQISMYPAAAHPARVAAALAQDLHYPANLAGCCGAPWDWVNKQIVDAVMGLAGDPYRLIGHEPDPRVREAAVKLVQGIVETLVQQLTAPAQAQ